MLWIALHLPRLSLESFEATLPPPAETAEPRPVALVAAHRLVHANATAESLGLQAGLKRATALALAPQTLLGEADASRDLAAITAVAHAALGFTPSVCFDTPPAPDAAPQGVLLEVQASLRYFGGARRLLQRLQAALQPLGHRVVCASAPTAQGAALLARWPQPPQGRHAGDLDALCTRLDVAPPWLLERGRTHWDTLQAMGLATCGELRRLPRAGLARRFGEALLDELDRALGERPDPRRWIELPPAFTSRLELHARADTTEQVMHGATLLLVRLLAWAGAQQAQVQRFTLTMQHEPRHRRDARTPPCTALEVGLAEPSSDMAHLTLLLRERLARLELAAPTLELRLACSDVVHRAPPNGELFPTAGSRREGLTRLVERLQARLGGEQVQRLVCVADHRPERANRAVPVSTAVAAGAPALDQSPRRSEPVWLLPEPQPLAEREALPLLEGRVVQLVSGPERIETGWWDAGFAERDYFVGQAADGALVWLYRARRPPSSGEGARWFLHGWFG